MSTPATTNQVMRSRHASLDETLNSIERRVVGEVWIGRSKRSAGAGLTALLIAVSATNLTAAIHAGHRVAVAASCLSLAASLISLVGLGIRRFGWSCAAAYACALATVACLGTFWWYRTGSAETWTAALAWPLAGLLSAGWVSVLVTPIQRSQPDMRSYALSDDRTF